MATIGNWHMSAWYSTDLDASDRRRFDDIGINIRRTRGNLTIHMGPNKLSRHRGYQAGIEVDGSRSSEFAIARIWFVYWTLTLGLSWSDSERAKRWKEAHV
jgi:hypothetical protein